MKNGKDREQNLWKIKLSNTLKIRNSTKKKFSRAPNSKNRNADSNKNLLCRKRSYNSKKQRAYCRQKGKPLRIKKKLSWN